MHLCFHLTPFYKLLGGCIITSTHRVISYVCVVDGMGDDKMEYSHASYLNT